MASCINSFHEHDYLTRNTSTLHTAPKTRRAYRPMDRRLRLASGPRASPLRRETETVGTSHYRRPTVVRQAGHAMKSQEHAMHHDDAHLPYIVPHNTQREHQPGVAGPTGIDCRYALARPAHDDAQACSWRRSLMTSHHARDEAAAHGVSEAWTNMFHSSSSARSQPCVTPFGALFGPPPRDLNLLELFWDRLEAQLEALQSGSIFGAP
jgi:hypothetical protein